MSKVTLEIEHALWAKGAGSIAGVDEAGRGPLAGPVVAASVIFPREVMIEGVNDSKKLTESQRESLYDVIRAQAVAVGVGIVSHEVIDRINILQATILAMHKAIEDMKGMPDFVIVDGNSFRHETLRFQNIIGGDAKSFTIAAASIIAKVTRDRTMREFDHQYPNYGFAQHKGYGTRRHLDAIREFGLCEIHRKTFHSI
ncbi:MAG: ribonuclease HII [Bacteroidota bacterium]